MRKPGRLACVLTAVAALAVGGVTAAPMSEAAPLPRCHTWNLRGEIVLDDAAAGSRFGRVILTNIARHTCALYGYGGMRLVDEAGNPLPTHLTRVPQPGPTLVTLRPGQQAHKNLRWGVVPVEGEPVDQPCQQPAAGADVTPPDETTSLRVWYPIGPVCDFGRIDGSAYHRG